jgi:hypothetical protein
VRKASKMPDFVYDPDDDEDAGTPVSEETKETNFQQLRQHARKLERDLKKSQEAEAALRTKAAQYEAQERERQASGVFTQIGLGEKQAQAFVKLNPEAEITRETAIAFARDIGLPVEISDDDERNAEQEATSFRPISIGGVSPAKGRVSYEEYRTLLANDPTTAVEMLRQGRVDGILQTT